MSQSYTITKDPLYQELPKVPPPIRSKQPAANIQGFFDLVSIALALHIKAVGNPNSVVPIFVAEFPKERITQFDTAFDAIVYKVNKSQIANTTNDGVRKPKRPMIRDVVPNPTKPNYQLVISAWWEQVDVTFEMWSKDAASANRLTEWFHSFIFTWAYVIKYFEGSGIENFEFLERLEDAASRQDEQEIYCRPLKYTFRLNRQYALERRVLTSIEISLADLKF